MSTYKTDRDRNYGFVGKFKFSYTVTLVSDARGATFGIRFNNAQVSSGALINFKNDSDTFNASVIIGRKLPTETDQYGNGNSNWFTYLTAPNYDLLDVGPIIPLYFKLKGAQELRGIFILDVQQELDTTKDSFVGKGQGGSGVAFYFREVSGTVEGYVYNGNPLTEYVEISEHYPLKETLVPSNCDADNQVWVADELTEKTVRQWPKYTTLNWFETVNPNLKSRLGIYIVHTKSNGQITRHSRFLDYSTNDFFLVSYKYTKSVQAWQTRKLGTGPSFSQSGYIKISGNVDFGEYKITPLIVPNGVVTEDTWDLRSDPSWAAKAAIEIEQEPARKVTFDSQIFYWDKPYGEYLKGYIVGFGSTGLTSKQNFSCQNKNVVIPTFQTVETKSGKISGSQTYVDYTIRNTFIETQNRFTGELITKYAPNVIFSNLQKWIFGAIDRRTAPEEFDTLLSPTKFMDYPEKWVRLSCGCVDINEESRFKTLDFDEDFFGCAPIPLLGWKFNAMTLVQDKEYVLSANGSTAGFGYTSSLSFMGTKANPYYYGSENLSGYRYLQFDAKSKNKDAQKSTFTISEISKGFTISDNNQNLDKKSWDISIKDPASTNSFIIDLCNPNNKIDYVDNQDSPYPRLNTYTTSKPQNTDPLGLLSVENKPKDGFLITKPISGNATSNWINDKIKKKIKAAGIIYLSDDVSKNIDYFDVDVAAFPKAGVGTNIIFGRPRVFNGKIKLSNNFNSFGHYIEDTNGNIEITDPDYFKQLEVYIVKNDLTLNKTIDDILLKDKDGKYPEEFEIYDYEPGFPDETDVIGKTNLDFIDGSQYIFVNPISFFDKNTYFPYDAVIIEDGKKRKVYELVEYNKTNPDRAFISIKVPASFDSNIIFKSNSSIKLGFLDGKTDDRLYSIILKFNKVEKISNNNYLLHIEYSKLDKNSLPNYDGIPPKINGENSFFFANAPIVSVNPPRLLEFNFPKDTILFTKIIPTIVSENEVNAIDDYPEDEASNGPYYGVSRIANIESSNALFEFDNLKLIRKNSLSNFVYSGNNTTFQAQTKFDASSTTSTDYYTRRFWQQNTDARDEEEGDITWQHTVSENVDYWLLFPKSISSLCDDINKVDEYVAPRWLNPNNPSSSIIRHPGWIAEKIDKSYPTDPVTGDRIYSISLDPEYLNPDSGYATWLYGGGVLAVPSGVNSGSGTSYITAIDISFNEMKTILAQTIFHRINADFPPGKPDLFGNTSLRNEDGSVQESTLHLRGGLITRGPGYGLILPPKQSTPEDLRKANLIEASTGASVGSSESNFRGYFQTSNPFGKNKVDHYIELEKSKNFPNPSDFRSSTRNFTQAKRERAAFKGGKEKVATNLSACESGFEKSIVLAYTIPGAGATNAPTAIIQTDSFFDSIYEIYPVGFDVVNGIGITLSGKFPYVLSSESHATKSSRVNTYLLVENTSEVKSNSSSYFSSVIAANTNMRNKTSWYPYIDGEPKIDANFSTLSKAFEGTVYNSYIITDESPELFNVGYADPGAIIVRSVPLGVTNIQAPVTDKSIFIDGIVPTNSSQFRLLDPILSSGTAVSSFSTITQLASRDYLVAYSLKETPRKVHFKIISNYTASRKNLLLDLDSISGNSLNDDYNIYGLTSSYDELLNIHRSVFWSNGGIYYFENSFSSSSIGNSVSSKLHLIRGSLDDKLVSELQNRKNIITYFDNQSDLNKSVPKQRPAIISCKNENYYGKVIVAYDTGDCSIEAVLFNPYFDILGTRKFDIECVNNLGSDNIDANGQDKPPIADIQANPTSGQSELKVDFLSTNSYDPNGSVLTYSWDFGDGNKSTEENPSHTFVNNTTNPIEFKVTLIVTNSSGIKSVPATITITVNPSLVNNLSPQAKFSATPTSGDVTLTVTFTDQSTAANDGSFIQIYQWDFGDGNTAIKFDNKPFTYDYMVAGSFVPKLYVKDNLGRLSSSFIGPTINVNGKVNNPPSPNFTWSQTSYSPTLKVQFTDASVDVEGPLVAWHWDFGDTQTADVQNPEHIYASPGKYRVTLTVTDSGGLQASGTIEITVLPPGNNPPIANFIYSQQNRKLVIDFTDTSTDSDGTIATWNWNFGDNSTSTVQNPSHTYISAGTYQVILTVTDNGGKSSSITKNVIVNPLVNQAPIISNLTGTQTSYKPLVGKFTETSSDPDGFITQWDWNFGDGHIFSTTDPTLKNPTNTYLFPGIYTVTLTVTDDGLPDGTNKKTATSSIQFIVSPPPANQPPTALFTVNINNVLAPATILFTDSSTDADGKIVSWLWEFETGSTLFFNAQTYQKVVSHTFTKSGTYPVKLTVTDDGNLTNTYILDIIVKNNAPVAILTAFPNPALSQTQVSFFGNTSYDIDGTIVKYAWDFGDTTIISQGTAFETHTYAKPGTYKASLTVTDNIGDSSTANLFINVTNRSPVARITYTTLTVKAPGSLTFNGDTSSDIDGTIASYSWSVSGSVVATTPNATINFTTQGTYVVSLAVTDDFGATNTASVTVNVTPPDNILPISILRVNKNSGVINDTFIFNVSGSYDPDGSIILYQLDFGDGTSTQFVNPAPVSHVYKTVGVFTAKLTVTDNRSGVSLETIDSVQVITINNQPPVASFSFTPTTGFTFDTISFTDTSSDPENALSKWVWDFGDNTNFTTTDPLQKNPTKSYNKGNKDYTVTLTVYDNFGLSSSASQIVHINNRKPFAVISTNYTPVNNVITGTAPFTVIFDSNSYDLDGKVVNYEWYINGLVGTPFTTKSFTYTFNAARFTPYSVTLRVQDDDGDWSDIANIGVKVNPPNIPPVAVIKANPASNSSFAPVSVTFSAAGSYDPDNIGGPLAYAWDFGNGSFSDQIDAGTTYNSSGTYKVSLTVTDNLGATNTATLDYIVKNNKPIAVLDTVPTGITQVQVNTSVQLTSQGSYDTDTNQFINGYKWLIDGVNQNSNTPTLSASFGTVGNHVVTLSVFDNLGLESDPVSKTIVVIPVPPANQNPIAILGNEPSVTGYIELKVGDSYTFDGTTSYDPEDGSNITFEWSIDGVKSGYTSTFVNQFNTIGIFTISLVVFDTQKLASTPATNLGKRYSVQVNVSAAPNPLANKLFSAGSGYYGAIASGNNTQDRYGFQLVDDTKQYTLISAGGNHTLVVDADGKLYASGSNAEGQLGFPSNITQLNSLTLVPLASKYKVVRICAGDFESAIIAEDTSINKRVLLVCGNNSYGIFGQSLPRTNIFNFQPIIERNITSNGVSYASNNSLLDVSCNRAILAFIDNTQVWVSGAHHYPNKIGIVDNGFIPINIDPNPDNQIGSTNYLNPIKLSVGYEGSGLRGAYVAGIGYDIYNQIVWFTGLTSLRGWGYAYDIAVSGAFINIISASQNQFDDRCIIFYQSYASETPNFLGSSQSASLIYPGEFFIKIESGTSCLLALTQNHLFAYGSNQNGCMGLPQSFNSSSQFNLQGNLPFYYISSNDSVIGPYEISTGGAHSLVLASDVKPSGNNFTIIRPDGYPSVNNLTIYPITQVQQ